jgi:sugar lactone lactonase YvrE
MFHRSDSSRRGSRAAIALIIMTSVLLLAALPALAGSDTFPPLIALPDGFQPEGIATGRGSSFYAGNLYSGALLRGDYRTGTVQALASSPGPGAQAVGLKVDTRTNYLYVAASTFGARVFDAATGALVREYPFAPTGGNPVLANDVVVTADAAYFTDSCSATLYKLPLDPGGWLPDPAAVEAIPLTGDFQFVYAPLPGYPCGFPNMNGIVATENGKWLIVNNTVTGQLYRVDPSTGASTQIQLLNDPFGTRFTDGLLLHGDTLYSIENFLNRIAVIDLAKDLLTGTIEGYITSPNFDVPATAAFFGDRIYAVNARFRLDGSAPPSVDDDIVQVGR